MHREAWGFPAIGVEMQTTDQADNSNVSFGAIFPSASGKLEIVRRRRRGASGWKFVKVCAFRRTRFVFMRYAPGGVAGSPRFDSFVFRAPVLPTQCLQISRTHKTLRKIDTPDEAAPQAVQRIECLLRALWADQSRSGAGSARYALTPNRSRRSVPLRGERDVKYRFRESFIRLPGNHTTSQSILSADFTARRRFGHRFTKSKSA